MWKSSKKWISKRPAVTYIIAWVGLGLDTSIDLSERNINDPIQNMGSDAVISIRIEVR